MKNKWIIIVVGIVIIVLIVIGLVLYFKFFNSEEIKSVCINDECFEVEIAMDSESRELGLMGRESLCMNCGMLFVFENSGKHGFWMKNTLISLDIIWINSDMRIVSIVEAEPCLTAECTAYTPLEDSMYVLEINYGFSRENGLKMGDLVEINL
ncbi:DUF192 domain-containing protein [Candidatus Pacearchaeota archaeon]|nr:DUF192 domain-containing protein [Candidatus Pacearchaeota archaeon]